MHPPGETAMQSECSDRRRSSLRCPSCLEQEPCPPLGLVDPVFQEACGRDVAMLVTQVVCFAHFADQRLVVIAQFGEHVLWRHVIGIVVFDALQSRYVADGAQRSPTDLADALGYIVRRGENLIALLVKHQMVVSKMR